MNISYRLRKKIIDLSGYWIYKRRDLPIGADFFEDITRRLNVSLEIVFDVGANYGQTALNFANEFSSAKVYSFEPVESSFQKLTSATQHLHNVSCFHNAFGESKNIIEISLFSEENSQLNSLKVANELPNARKEIVSVITIDDFLQENKINKIDLLKIDTEGYEIEVLKGANISLHNNRVKLILCEVALSFINNRNTQLVEVINFLKPFNYSLLGLYDTNANQLFEGTAYSNALFIKI